MPILLPLLLGCPPAPSSGGDDTAETEDCSSTQSCYTLCDGNNTDTNLKHFIKIQLSPIYTGEEPYNEETACFQEEDLFVNVDGHDVAFCRQPQYQNEPLNGYLQNLITLDPFIPEDTFLFGTSESAQTEANGNPLTGQDGSTMMQPTPYQSDSLAGLLSQIDQDLLVPDCLKEDIKRLNVAAMEDEGGGGKYLLIFRRYGSDPDPVNFRYSWQIIQQTGVTSASPLLLSEFDSELLAEAGFAPSDLHVQSFADAILATSHPNHQTESLPYGLVVYVVNEQQVNGWDLNAWFYYDA